MDLVLQAHLNPNIIGSIEHICTSPYTLLVVSSQSIWYDQTAKPSPSGIILLLIRIVNCFGENLRHGV